VLRLVQNPNFIAELPASLLKVGFAAETQHVLEQASAKRLRRGFDIICANDVSRADIGFEVDINEVIVIDANGIRAQLARAHKYSIANAILSTLVADFRVAVANRGALG
jgi:phosphopantothenoylcysteine decarboxylase/phosphopantothenate--cysteine ligase